MLRGDRRLQFTLTSPVILCAVCLAPRAAHSARADEDGATRAATITRLDGSSQAGRLAGIGDGRVRLIADGQQTVIPLIDVAGIEFAPTAAPASAARVERSETTFFLCGGGEARGAIVGGGDEAVAVSFDGGPDRAVVSFDDLAAVRFAEPAGLDSSEALFQQALADRRPAEDVLITRDAGEAKSVRGALESLNAEEGSFRFGGRARTFQIAHVYAIVLAAGVATTGDPSSRASLTDGSIWPGELVSATASQLEFITAFRTPLTLPLDRVRRINFRSDRVVPLSGLAWRDEQCEGVLHRPGPVRRDVSAGGGPLMLDGRQFERGIGMHSHCRITFDLEGAYETFAAWIGIDDAVRPRGHAVYRVVGDGKTLFESQAVTGRDKASLIRVSLAGVKVLTLIVDYGEGFDLADHADWADARLIKAAGESA